MCLVIQQSWFPGSLSIYPCRPLSNTNDWHIYSTSLSSDSTKVAVQILKPRSSVVTHASQSGNSRLLGTAASQEPSTLAHTAAHAQQWGEAVSVHCHPGYTHAPSELTEILWRGKIWKGNLHGLRQRSSARPPISKKLKSIRQENHIFFPSNRNCTRITLGPKNQICLLHTKSAAAVARTCASRSDWNTLSSSNTTASIL